MREEVLVQRLLLLLHENYGRTSYVAQTTVEWLQSNLERLLPAVEEGLQVSWETLPDLARRIDAGSEEACPLRPTLNAVAGLLDLGPFDLGLLDVALTLQRSRLLAPFAIRIGNADADVIALAAAAAGGEIGGAVAAVRRSQPVLLGLLSVEESRGAIEASWNFARLLDQGLSDPERLLEGLVGVRQRATLSPSAFCELATPFDMLRRLLRGALAERAEGVNVLLHGPPGTGKTEFARTLAQAAGAGLLAVGEQDFEGEEPNRWDRLHALKRAQRMLCGRGDTLLLFDEMEDLFSDPTCLPGAKAGSKLFVNRLLERNAVPVIWTSNSLDEVDPAHLRRMSYVLRMGHPSPGARQRVVAAIAGEEGQAAAAGALAPLVAREPEAASVARVALRAARLAGGASEDAGAAARSLVAAVRGVPDLAPLSACGALDLSLYEADTPIAQLVARIAADGAPADVSVLLTGPPGTGKTALAAHLAERLDRPLLVKRASDLLSRWVGGTEANIAQAFSEARQDGAVLLFDEADSLLLDRGGSRTSWEVSQVNELLTWMDGHRLPFVAATNYPERLDPAAMRRFVFKLALRPLSPGRSAAAFERFFGTPAPPELARIAGLTPGDFAVVARQLRFAPARDATEIARLLESEARAKPMAAQPVGF